jgi:hypothetical protein
VGKIVAEHRRILGEGACSDKKDEGGFEKKPLFVQVKSSWVKDNYKSFGADVRGNLDE